MVNLSKTQVIQKWLVAGLSPTLGAPANTTNKIAYLDGIRGFAALCVYWGHHLAFAADNDAKFHHAFGFRDQYYFCNLPFVRLFGGGAGFAVPLFAIVSGYVISIHPLRILHAQRAGHGAELAAYLGCVIPKRWIRLFVPAMVITFAFMTSWHLTGVTSFHHDRAGSWFLELQEWTREVLESSYFYLQSTEMGFSRSGYNPHLWYVVLEFRASATIYVMILSFFALDLGPTARVWTSLGLIAYFQFFVDGSFMAVSVLGMLLCDIDLGIEYGVAQLPRLVKFRWSEGSVWYYVLLLIGMYLGGVPMISSAEALAKEPGWSMLSYLVSPMCRNTRWYFATLGAPFWLISIPRIPWLRRCFESRSLQYLGMIAFGMYLVHGPVLWIWGDRVYAAVGRPRDRAGKSPTAPASQRIPNWINVIPVPDVGPAGFELNIFAVQLVLLPLTLWMGAVVSKLVVLPTMIVSNRLLRSRQDTEPATAVVMEKGKEAKLPR